MKHILWYAKNKQTKQQRKKAVSRQAYSLSHYPVTLVSRHRTQSVENSTKYIYFKFSNNILEVFQVILKALLA